MSDKPAIDKLIGKARKLYSDLINTELEIIRLNNIIIDLHNTINNKDSQIKHLMEKLDNKNCK